ncbi:hypothetical protein Q2T41_19110 [Maribacter confluentis]|uniref:DUF4295 domain-containing protein n=1 Tax=Maribacter confluentis TaxID=1656093 RepID=A0ABT8RWN0_9FLAO|nr:hypothetical protein [Maribacter confluentis]MDO1514769.1 hypothetical protein [Maribacter confluentis]
MKGTKVRKAIKMKSKKTRTKMVKAIKKIKRNNLNKGIRSNSSNLGQINFPNSKLKIY